MENNLDNNLENNFDNNLDNNSNKIFKCEICNKNYKSKVGLWRHNQKFHEQSDQDNLADSKEYTCSCCNKKYSNKYSKYKHQTKCKASNNQIEQIKLEFNDEIIKLKQELETIKNKPATINNIKNINKGVINHNKGPVYNFLSKPGEENLNVLSEKEIEYILEQEMNCLVCMVELLNFNDKHPENHSFCTTALNDKYINTLNSETLMIEKMRKKDFFDLMLNNSLKNIRFLYDKLKHKKTPKAIRFKQTIDNLTEYVVVNHKGKKAYLEMMNTLSFNKRHITQSTWFQLMNNQIPQKENVIDDSNSVVSHEIKEIKAKTKDKLINLPDSDESDDDLENSDSDELPEIKIQGKSYYLDGSELYLIEPNGKRGDFYGNLINGKVKKNKNIIL